HQKLECSQVVRWSTPNRFRGRFWRAADQFQGLDLRFVPAAGMGFHWVKTDRTRFDPFNFQ
ncbi:MAG: DUF481 domain-containing protein, partial [Acidobacteria bacterium]